jgi:hypothetical protein
VLPIAASAPVVDTDNNSFAADLPERPSPDGREDCVPTSHAETEAWPDWDVPDNAVSCPFLAATSIDLDKEYHSFRNASCKANKWESYLRASS